MVLITPVECRHDYRSPAVGDSDVTHHAVVENGKQSGSVVGGAFREPAHANAVGPGTFGIGVERLIVDVSSHASTVSGT